MIRSVERGKQGTGSRVRLGRSSLVDFFFLLTLLDATGYVRLRRPVSPGILFPVYTIYMHSSYLDVAFSWGNQMSTIHKRCGY